MRGLRWVGVAPMLSCLCAHAATRPGGVATVARARFGTLPDGAPVDVFTLTDAQLTVRLITFGARMIDVEAPGRDGVRTDVVLGYPTLDEYVADKSTYAGSTVGRYANRIAGGAFELDGKRYELPVNNPPNTLHGGAVGFDRANWRARVVPAGVVFSLVSPDGDQGFPGRLSVEVRYTLRGNTLRVMTTATTNKPTVLNLTNHSYFNLTGGGDILGETVRLAASRYLPVDAHQIPLGQPAAVAGTPFDLRTQTPIGRHIEDADEQLRLGGGYDHTWVLDGRPGTLRLAAEAADPVSGRTLEVRTTEPGVQFYTGNSLKGETHAADGRPYTRRSAFCLETQHFPDTPNHPSFPTTTLRPGQIWRSTTTLRFGTAAAR